MVTCAKCSASHDDDVTTCPECGFDPIARQQRHDAQDKALNRARTWILFMGIVYALGGVLYFVALGKDADPTMRQYVLWGNLALAAIHVGLYYWARQAPFHAAVAALSLFIVLQLAIMILSPGNMFSGIILKVIFFVILIKAVGAGREAQQRHAG